MALGIIKLLKNIFRKKEKEVEEVSTFPTYDSDKPYSKMNFKERVRYKRWLDANDMWDGEIVIENVTDDLTAKNIKQNAKTTN